LRKNGFISLQFWGEPHTQKNKKNGNR